jgi:predicted nucleic acid-binding protein
MADAFEQEGSPVPDLDLFIAASAGVWGDGIVLTRDIAHFGRLRRFGVQALLA